MIKKYKGYIFDLDGTIYRSDKLIPNADKVIEKLKSLGKKIIFISNKTTGSVQEYYEFLRSKNIDINENDIITSTTVIIKYLTGNHPGALFYAIGEELFVKELTNNGLVFSTDPKKIQIVIVTLDRTLNYNKLEIAAKALENGARFYAANIDDTCPVEGGEITDAGSIITALEKRTHKKLEKHFGKPSKYMIDEIRKRLNLDLGECLIVGDRLETDIAMGNKFNIDSALVSTGVTNYLNGKFKPTYRINSVYDLIEGN